MNKYVAKASLVLLGWIIAGALVAFLLCAVLLYAPVQFILGIFFFVAAIGIMNFMVTLVLAAKDSVMRRAREYARKDGFKDGIHV